MRPLSKKGRRLLSAVTPVSGGGAAAAIRQPRRSYCALASPSTAATSSAGTITGRASSISIRAGASTAGGAAPFSTDSKSNSSHAGADSGDSTAAAAPHRLRLIWKAAAGVAVAGLCVVVVGQTAFAEKKSSAPSTAAGGGPAGKQSVADIEAAEERAANAHALNEARRIESERAAKKAEQIKRKKEATATIGGTLYYYFDEYSPFPGYYRTVRTAIVGEEKPLIPPEMPDMFGFRPRTVVLGFEKTLAFSVWDRREGWKTRKRPYLDKFIRQMSGLGYELVIWSDGWVNDHEPILADWDKDTLIPFRLYRDHTNRPDWWHTRKNLDRLHRDPKRVIVVDASAPVVLTPEHQKNALHINGWSSDLEDKKLQELIPFFEKIKQYNVLDVQSYIGEYNKGKTMDEIFASDIEAARQVSEQRERASKSKGGNAAGGGGGGAASSGGSGGFLGGLFGRKG